ncbi:ASB2, partial [Symbiodinium necroappetens]
ALALRALGCSSYGAADVAVAGLSLVPFLGEACDSLKDSVLAAQAIASDTGWVRAIGCGALGYLWLLHLAVLLPNKSTRLELCRGYLALLFVKRKAAGSGYSLWKKLLQLFYKQSTPTRRWAMVLEDAPQGVIASVISVADGLKPFALIVNLVLPFARLLLAWMYHDHVSWEVQDWLKNEALDAYSAGRLALCDDYMSALHRLEGVAQKRGWGSVLAVREQLQTLIPTRSADTERARAGDACPCMWKSERARV